MTGRRLAVGSAVLGLALLTAAVLVGFGPGGQHGRAGTVRAPAAAGVLPSSTPSPSVRSSSVPASAHPSIAASAPGPRDRLQLRRLGLDAPIVSVRLAGRVLQVPRDPGRVGWWRDGAKPGAAHGSAVIVGHVNYAGTTGALAVLPRIRPGDHVVLTRPELTFRVAAVRTYAKTSGIPQSAFSVTGPPQLVLITCGGPFDPATGNYRDNIVVYAVRS